MDGSRQSSVSHEASPQQDPGSMATAPQPRAPAPVPAKKAKGKKAPDPLDNAKQVQARLAQLEQEKAGDKELEAEIEREGKKASRDLAHTLSSIESPLARIELVQKKYLELFQEMKRTEKEHVKSKKRADQLQKEKDAKATELSKEKSVKAKLETLSHTLNKEKKSFKEELDRTKLNETRLREELHDKLETMVAEVEDVIQSREYPEPASQDLEMDEIFRQKFKSFIDQYEIREIQFQSLLKTRDLEIEYLKAKFERQRKAQEMESSKSHQLTRQVSTFSQTESELRTQLNIYVEKFKQSMSADHKQVEETLNNSNDLFMTFRKEMEEMSKKTKRLEKENMNLTRKQEAASRSILEMAEERTKRQEEMDKYRKRAEELEKLCRLMQDQGRAKHLPRPDEVEDDAGTESEYDEEEDYASGEEYEDEEDDLEDDLEPDMQAAHQLKFGPEPPPPPPTSSAQQAHPQALRSGRLNGHAVKQHQTPAAQQAKQVNGIKH